MQHVKLLVILILLASSPALHAERILVIGDSWAQPVAPQLQTVLHENGYTHITVEAGPFMSTTWRMNYTDGHAKITALLEERPDVTIVQMSTGGNDWQETRWSPAWAGGSNEKALLSDIMRNAGGVVDHILSLRPDIQILWSSYDFPRPVNLTWKPIEVNTFLITLADEMSKFADSRPGVSFVDINGALQVAYGFDGIKHPFFGLNYYPVVVIPPGDPSLPNPEFPSPFQAFLLNDSWHLTPDGYKTLAQAQYDGYYRHMLAGNNFHINAGHSGAWSNPETSGQGLLIDVMPATQFMFLAWFTFTAGASNNPDEQHWYTAQGNYSGDTAELTLYETLGGQFDDPQEVSTNPVGTATVSFSDCEQGQMVYSIDTDGRGGTIPLERAIPGSGNVCEEQSSKAANTTEAVDINAGMDGAWNDADKPGQGFLIDAHPNPDGGNFIFVAWFTYGDDTASGQRWLTAQGNFAGSTADIDIYETTGGSFNDPQPSTTNKAGTMTIDFTDCSNALLAYSLADEGVAGDIAISRVLIPGGQELCEELAGAD